MEAVRKSHDGREPARDEMQRFNICQIRDVPQSSLSVNNSSDSKAAKEKQKALKRRCRKMKQRMAARGQEWEESQSKDRDFQINGNVESSNKAKFRRNLKELDRLCNNHGKTTWPSVAIAGLERCVGEISRAFNKYVSFFRCFFFSHKRPSAYYSSDAMFCSISLQCASDQDAFNSLNGFTTLTNLLNLGLNVQNTTHYLPNK